MNDNTKYGKQLADLTEKLRKIQSNEKYNTDEYKKEQSYERVKRQDTKRSHICLFLSVFLTAVAIAVPCIPQLRDLVGIPVYAVAPALLGVQIVNLILVCVSEDFFTGYYLILLIPPVFVLAPFVFLYILIRESRYNAARVHDCVQKQYSLYATIQRCQKERADTEKKLKQVKGMIANAELLYSNALHDNDMDQMKKAADQGHAQATLYIQQKKADEYYTQAMATDPADDTLMEKAAELGHKIACLYIGKKLVTEATSGQFTQDEREKIMEEAAEYLEVAKDDNLEAKYLWLSARVMYESHTEDDWLDILEQARDIKKSGKLPDCYQESINTLITSLVETVDGLRAKPKYNPQPKEQKWYCEFNNAGICTRESSAAFVAHCNFQSSPYLCQTARTYKAYKLIEY